MTAHLAGIVATGLLAAAGSAVVAAPQTSTARPGEPTQARVFVENRPSEPVPVNIVEMSASARPLRVEVAGTPIVALPPTTVVQARAVAQRWEHRLVTIPAGQDPGTALTGAGENWEAVGFAATPQGGLTVLLKRPM